MGEAHKLGAFRDGGIHHALVLIVISGDNLSERGEPAALGDGDAGKVHGVVQGSLEALGLEVQRIHHLLGVTHGKFGGGCLENVPGILGAEAENLLSVHHGLAKAISKLGYSFFRPFMADGIEIHAPGYAGDRGEEAAVLLGAANLLDDDSHLLLRNDVSGGGDVTP